MPISKESSTYFVEHFDEIFADIQQALLRHANSPNSNLEKICALFLLGVAYEQKRNKEQ